MTGSTPSQRAKNLLEAEVVVIKVGSRVLSNPQGNLNLQRIKNLAKQLARIAELGKRVVLVSSGAVACGIGKLKLEERPSDLSELQAVASVGQVHLIQAYENELAQHGFHSAQVLLTAEDLDHRARYLNVRNTLTKLLELNVIPIINENDAVSVDELLTTFGDNDRLAAMVAGLFERPALVILSDVEGLYRSPPTDGSPREVIPVVEQIDEGVLAQAQDKSPTSGGLSKGGMASKLKAAQFATRGGAAAFIASGHVDDVVLRILADEELGTLFLPQPRALTSRKRWIGFSAQTMGSLYVDEGATRALNTDGPSLLAIGITRVEGEFVKGDVISIRDAAGREIARGLTNYDTAELSKIKGLRSTAFQQVLGHAPYKEVVHRDNLALL